MDISTINDVKNQIKDSDKNQSNRIYWCANCDVPLLQETCQICHNIGVYIGSSLKPVFKDEYQLYKQLLSESSISLNERFFPWILFRRRNQLFSDTSKGQLFVKYNLTSKGKSFVNLVFEKRNNDFSLNRSKIKKEIHFLDDADYKQKLIKANLLTLKQKEDEAITFIKGVIEKYPNYKVVSSFSGGKDSLVTTALLKKAFDHPFDIVYSNTGIEFEETVRYINEYISNFGNLVHLKAKREFEELCKILGPPSRMMRWCCFTQKGAPINDYYSKIAGKVLSFDGIRRDESNLRANYPRIKENTKITKQLSAYPILNWSELDVWLYIFWQDLRYNPLYDKGFSRCGCWACPNNSQFDWYLFEHFYPKKFKSWIQLLDNYAKSEERYAHDWIWDGSWKSRKVKYMDENIGSFEEENDPFSPLNSGVEASENDISLEEEGSKRTKLCLENDDFIINLKEKVTKKTIEFLKPFGKITHKKANEKNITVITGKQVKIKIPENSHLISVQILDVEKLPKIKRKLELQIVKALNCIDCAACTNSCKYGAIVFRNKTFEIDETSCVHCLECCTTKYLTAGCVALHYKSKRKKLS
ncbi:MAG: phosphoadenosine phosphosulfate reductase family protein [Candidatus Heimdallarchaeota archaeon]|nr:phosphoadenosine phosphosulfate reductase family protein [Candidatus Heimdallarchaeota archaeon]